MDRYVCGNRAPAGMCARVAAPVEPKPARFVKVTTVTADVSPDDEAAWDAMECGAVREGLLPLRLARVSGDGVKEEVFLELTDGTRLPVMVAR